MTVLTDSASVAAFCAEIEDARFVTIDTEFMRDVTYWPKLCLIQVAGPERAVAIDALADGIDLDPVWRLLVASPTLKVFHAARQDIEIVYHVTGKVPAPLFDSQVAAMVCGFGEAASYETLAAKLAGARLDKTMRFTDWANRPLSARQIDYALADVIHLRQVYEKLARRLRSTERADWVAEEMATLTDPSTYALDPATAWRRLKTRSAKPRFLAILRELAAWREAEAQRRDVPRNRVLRDETLSEIAAHRPTSLAELANLRGTFRRQVEGGAGESILAAVRAGLALPEELCPQPDEPRPRADGATTELLKVLLRLKCEANNVAQKLVAGADDIHAIAADDAADVPALKGWRRELFGEDALKLKHGQIALTTEGAKLKLVALDR